MHNVLTEDMCWIIIEETNIRTEEDILSNVYDQYLDLWEVGGGGDWMELAQDRDRWGALVNTVMNFRVP